jgi:endonuclease I
MRHAYFLLIFMLLGCTVVKPLSNPPTPSTAPEIVQNEPDEPVEVELEVPESPEDSLIFAWGNYYGAYQGLRGEALKSHLHGIIRNHRVLSYQQVWEALEFTDQCDSIQENVVLIYTKRSQAKSQRDRGTSFNYAANGYTLIDSWNREHVWPKSHGFPNERDTAYTDLHHLRPADRSVNSARNTRSFGMAEEVYFDNGGTVPTSCKTSRSDYSWEPSDAVKGDIARMMFYMVVRYEGPAYDLELVDYVVPNNNKLPILGKLSTLLEWHRNDPVDSRERNRNALIFERYQGNRNPFIDHPEFVDLIWN